LVARLSFIAEQTIGLTTATTTSALVTGLAFVTQLAWGLISQNRRDCGEGE
jgi:hypothetical protein